MPIRLPADPAPGRSHRRSLRLAGGRTMVGIRRFVARHRWTRWVPATLCATALVLSIEARMGDVEAARRAWEQTRSVPVAAFDHAPGDPIVVDLIELPLVAIPAAVADADGVTGTTARQHIGAGEVVTEADLASTGPLPLLTAGWRAVAVSAPAASGAMPGEVVDVTSDGIVICEGAVVVEADGDGVLLGVPPDVAPLIALAAESNLALLRTGLTGRKP